jgi:polysaccharide biosynthesis/export protein
MNLRLKWIVCLFAPLALTLGASAQFSGPALGVTQQGVTPPTPTTDPTILLATEKDQQLHPGDLLAVKIFGTPDFVSPVRVSVAGNVQLPLIGVLQVAGLTIDRAEDIIARRLADGGFYSNPQVTVSITDAASQFVSIGGEMHMIIPVTGQRHLLDVLAAAGPFPLTASRVITIVRPGVDKPIIIDLGSDPMQAARNNIIIMPGDSIIVSRVGVVYMLGAFKLQGAIPLQQNSPLTLMEATALAQGAGYEGKFNDLRIIRTQGLERKEVKVDIKKVMDGKAPDPVLQADDIVFLPSDVFKAAIKGGGINTLTSLVGLLLVAYETNH